MFVALTDCHIMTQIYEHFFYRENKSTVFSDEMFHFDGMYTVEDADGLGDRLETARQKCLGIAGVGEDDV